MKKAYMIVFFIFSVFIIAGCNGTKNDDSYQVFYSKIAGGVSFSLIIDASGNLYGMGTQSFGVLANGVTSMDFVSEPMLLTNYFDLLEDEVFVSIHTGEYHAVALTSNERIFTWGWNLSGQTGTGLSDEMVSTPMDITDKFELKDRETFIQIITGRNHTLILTSNGRVFGFGFNPDYELLTLDFNQTSSIISSVVYVDVPVDLTSYFKLDANDQIIMLGLHHAISKKGRLFDWGNYAKSLVEAERTSDIDKTVRDITSELLFLEEGEYVNFLPADLYIQTNLGRLFMLDVKYGFDADLNRTIDIIHFDHEHIQSNDLTIRLISSYRSEHILVRSNQEILVRGLNESGNLGAGHYNRLGGINILSPGVIIFEFETVLWDIEWLEDEVISEIHMSINHTLMYTSKNRLFAWGNNELGQLGIGSTEPKNKPSLVFTFVDRYK